MHNSNQSSDHEVCAPLNRISDPVTVPTEDRRYNRTDQGTAQFSHLGLGSLLGENIRDAFSGAWETKPQNALGQTIETGQRTRFDAFTNGRPTRTLRSQLTSTRISGRSWALYALDIDSKRSDYR